MDSKDIRNLQEAYLDVYDNIMEKEDSEYEKASDAALDSRYGYGRATGDKRSFGRAANRSSAAAALRALRRGERSGSGTSREAGSAAVHQGWAKTAQTSTDQTPAKKERRAVLANTPYSNLPDDEKEKDRVSFDAVRATYNRNRNINASYEPDLYDTILEYLINEGYADTVENAESIMVNMSEDWRESIVEEVLDEGYVDYRKGKLPSGRTPQQSLGQRRTRNQSRADLTTNYDLLTPRNPVATKFKEREVRARQVGNEMDAHTSFGGKIMKALSPGLGNRSGAAPRVAYGEPNTDRHQLARNRRGEPSTKD